MMLHVVQAGYPLSFHLDVRPFPKYHYEINPVALQPRRQVLSDESDRPDRLSLSNNRYFEITTSPLSFSCQQRKVMGGVLMQGTCHHSTTRNTQEAT